MEEFELNTIVKKSAQGVIALISRTFFSNIVSYGASLVIFTVLTPGEFGIFIAATAGQRIINFFTDFGLGAALVQKKEQVTQDDLTTAFTIQALLTFSIFIFVVIFQQSIASFFKFGEVATRLFLVLVFSIFLSSFKTIPSILLERKIHFQKLVVPQVIELLIFNVLLVILLLQGKGLDSYTWAFLVSGSISIPFFYLVSPWKISIGINKESLGNLKYGIQFQSKNILATIKDDVLTIFLTKLLPFTDLGYIGFGQRNAFFAYRTIVDNVVKVTFSTYSRIQDDVHALKRAIEKSLFLVSIAIFPILFGIIITAPYIIQYFPRWHNKWEPAMLSLTFFSLNALVSSLSGILVNVLDATGRVKTTLKLMVIWTILTWVLTALLIYLYGYNGVAIASFLVTLTIFITVYLVKKIVDFSFFGSIYKALLCSAIMVIFVYLFTKIYARDLFSTIAIIIAGGTIYLSSIYIFAGKEIKEDVKLIYKRV